jgi:hypothetical protein
MSLYRVCHLKRNADYGSVRELTGGISRVSVSSTLWNASVSELFDVASVTFLYTEILQLVGVLSHSTRSAADGFCAY